jgi:uncharacterized protein (TIGR02265 family)
MPIRVKGAPILSRFAFVRELRGEDGLQKVLGRLSEADRAMCKNIFTSGWYPFELSDHIGTAIAAELEMGSDSFLLMGEKSAIDNLTGPHKPMLSDGDPQRLLAQAPQIYRLYYDTGHREYERVDEKKAILRTYNAETFSRNDCLTVVGWHRKAIEMCGGRDVRVTETKCRAKGGAHCEYVCEWS